MKTIDILLVDDHPVIRKGLEELLKSAFPTSVKVTAVSDGVEAYQEYRKKGPDIIVTDLSMPIMDGFQLTRAIRETDARTPILIMTGYTNVASFAQLTKLRINGYITKRSAGQEIQLAVKKLLRGEDYFCSEALSICANDRTQANHKIAEGLLTNRELQILRLTCADHTQEEIAEKLSISRRTVEGHARRIRSKLQVKSMAGLVVKALRKGYLD